MQQPDFIQIPTQVLLNKSLQPADKVLFGYIYWMTKLKDGKCIASNTTLGKLAGIKARSVQSALERLEASDWIRRLFEPGNARKRLEIECTVQFAHLKSPEDAYLRTDKRTLRSNERTPTRKRTPPLRSNERHNKSNIIKAVNNSLVTNVTKGDPPPIKRREDIDNMFEFWETTIGYAISGNVRANRYACANLIKKHGEDRLSRVLKGVALANGDQYAPRIANFCDLQEKWDRLILWGHKKSTEKLKGATYKI